MNEMVSEAIARVCEALGNVSAEEIQSKGRTFRVATARQLVMWYLYRVGKMGYSEIGHAMGKHHATVMYGVRQIDTMIDCNITREHRKISAAAEKLRNTKGPHDLFA